MFDSSYQFYRLSFRYVTTFLLFFVPFATSSFPCFHSSYLVDCKTVRIFAYSSALYTRTVKQTLKTERETVVTVEKKKAVTLKKSFFR